MSDGGRERAPLGVKVLKPSQKWIVRRSAVRSIAWLGDIAWQNLKGGKKVFVVTPGMQLTISLA